jgi:hypothetical protein
VRQLDKLVDPVVGSGAPQQHRCVFAFKARKHECRDTLRLEVNLFVVSRREDERDRVRAEAAGRKHEGVPGGGVQPVRIVDKNNERCLTRRSGE